MSKLVKIFQMQHDLNKIIGRDSIDASEQQRHDWVFEYLFAAHDESSELIECFNLKTFTLENKDNAKIEIIDIIHFYVSLCHLLDVHASKLTDESENLYATNHKNYLTDQLDIMFDVRSKILEGYRNIDLFDTDEIRLFRAVLFLNQQISQCYKNVQWKWWSKNIKENNKLQFKELFNVDEFKSKLVYIFTTIVDISILLGITPEALLDIYSKKWQKNIDRQDNDYDVRFKTETDNEEIQRSINSSTTVTSDEKIGLIEIAPGQFKPVDATGCDLDMEALSKRLPDVKDNIIHGDFGNRK